MVSSHDVNLELGDVIRLRKAHPCGSHTWRVVRLGADIGLVCQGCRRRVVVPRRTIARRLQGVVSRSAGDLVPRDPVPTLDTSDP